MAKKEATQEDINKMLKRPKKDNVRSIHEDPADPTNMILELKDIQEYEHNPRREVNSAREDIKHAVRQRGIEKVFLITRRPGEPKFTLAAGGNTTLAIIQELFEETGDEKYNKIPCQFRPWVNEIDVMIQHYSENENRGDMIFIDKALHVRSLQMRLEDEEETTFSQRALSNKFKELGLKVGKTILINMNYAVDTLYGLISEPLRAGMGNHQIVKIKQWHSKGRDLTKRHAELRNLDVDFDSLFNEVLTEFNRPEWDANGCFNVLTERLGATLEIGTDLARTELNQMIAGIPMAPPQLQAPVEAPQKPTMHDSGVVPPIPPGGHPPVDPIKEAARSTVPPIDTSNTPQGSQETATTDDSTSSSTPSHKEIYDHFTSDEANNNSANGAGFIFPDYGNTAYDIAPPVNDPDELQKWFYANRVYNHQAAYDILAKISLTPDNALSDPRMGLIYFVNFGHGFELENPAIVNDPLKIFCKEPDFRNIFYILLGLSGVMVAHEHFLKPEHVVAIGSTHTLANYIKQDRDIAKEIGAPTNPASLALNTFSNPSINEAVFDRLHELMRNIRRVNKVLCYKTLNDYKEDKFGYWTDQMRVKIMRGEV